MKNSLLKTLTPFFIALLCMALIGTLLLAGVCLLPQEWLLNNLRQSDQMVFEGEYPRIYDNSSLSNQLDNYTDATIILESYYLDGFDAVWSNPLFNFETPTYSLHIVSTLNPEPSSNYSRYWGGFRVPYRFLLAFFDVVEIRHIVSICFFSLFAVAAYIVLKHAGIVPAAAFWFSIILVKPEIISNSFQFSCCFFIVFLAVLFLPYVTKDEKRYVVYFFVIGGVTQFFDFYTTPIITFGFPFCLYVIVKHNEIPKKPMLFLKSSLSWFSGYILMWIVKLSCTQIFTSEQAFATAFSSVKGRIGITKMEGREDSYNAFKALKFVFSVFCQRKSFGALLIVLVIGFTVFCVFKRKKSEVCNIGLKDSMKSSSVFLMVAGLAVIWYCVTASPTVIHVFYQYRSVSLIVFSVFLFIYYSICPQE